MLGYITMCYPSLREYVKGEFQKPRRKVRCFKVTRRIIFKVKQSEISLAGIGTYQSMEKYVVSLSITFSGKLPLP